MTDRRRRLLTAAAACLGLILLAASLVFLFIPPDGSARYTKYYDQARAMYDAGDYTGAALTAERALSCRSAQDAYLLRAEAQYADEDLPGAISTLYLGYAHTGSASLYARLEELKALRASLLAAEAETDETVYIGTVEVELEARELVISGQALTDGDIRALARLTRLESLDLTDNTLTDITPLTGLTSLTSLNLAGNRLETLPSLAKLTGLRTLYLDDNLIEDFSPVFGLPGLTTLSITGMPVGDKLLAELAASMPDCCVFYDEDMVYGEGETITLGGKTFPVLTRELDLSGLNLTDISALARCRNLRRLNLAGNSISDLSPLAQLPGLEWLSLMNNSVSNLYPLMGLTGLAYLDLEGNRVTDLTALSALTGLEELWLNYNSPAELSVITQLTGLKRLGLKGVALTDTQLAVVRGLSGLTELNLEDNPALTGEAVDEIKAALPGCVVTHAALSYTICLGNSTFLGDSTEISLSHVYLEDLSQLSKGKALTALRLESCGLTDLSGVAEVSGLTVLDLSGNPLTELSGLSGLTALSELSLADCGLTDAEPLAHLTWLKHLDLSDNPLETLSPLSSLTELETLDLRGCAVSAQALEDLQWSLPRCTILADVRETAAEEHLP